MREDRRDAERFMDRLTSLLICATCNMILALAYFLAHWHFLAHWVSLVHQGDLGGSTCSLAFADL